MKARLSIALALAAATSFAAVSQTPQAGQGSPPSRPAPPTPRKIPGVSDAGNAVLAKLQMTPDPQLGAVAKERASVHNQLIAAVMAPTPDVDKVAALLKQEDGLTAQLRTHVNGRMLDALRQLPVADRGPFLRGIIQAAASAGASQR